MCLIMSINWNSKFVAYFDMLHTNRTINSKSRLFTDLTFFMFCGFVKASMSSYEELFGQMVSLQNRTNKTETLSRNVTHQFE